MQDINSASRPPDAMRRNLVELCWLRAILMSLLCLTAAYCHVIQSGQLPWPMGLLLIFGLLVLINALTWLRLRSWRAVDDDELFLQLLFDLALFTMLFRLSGGSSNPFVTYYLVPLAIAASTLGWRQTGTLAGLMLLAYSSLFWWPSDAVTGVQWPWSSYQGHLIGMWVNFAISALLLVFFLGRMHRRLRAQDRYLAEQQRRQLQRDQAVAMGTLAAGAVHELATPLSTMTLLVEELEQAPAEPLALRELQAQLGRCRDILGNLREQARKPESLPAGPLQMHVHNCLQPLQVRYPACRFDIIPGVGHHAIIAMPWLLQQVIYNGVKNAAEAAHGLVTLTATLDSLELICRIRDDGPGFPDEALRSASQPVTSSKPDGLGLGLFLAHVTLSELGGSLALRNPSTGGAELEIRVPRWRLLPTDEEQTRASADH